MFLTHPSFDDDELDLVREALASRWVTQGTFVERFEGLVAKRHGAKHALAATSCTTALHLAVKALDLGPGDEVVVPAFTWVTSAYCVDYVGAKTMFADVEPETFNLDPRSLEEAITPKTRAVVAVHLFGLAADMDKVLEIASRHGLAVIEDAACAIGTAYKGRPVGCIGDLGCFSFHPRKLITTGEGGMVTTDSDDLAGRVNTLRNHGASPNQDPQARNKPWSMANFNAVGFNYRMSDIQGAVGVAQMAKLDGLIAERRRNAAAYARRLGGIDALALPPSPGDAPGHTYQSFVVRLREGGRERRNRVMEMLQSADIETRPGTHAVHMLGYYAGKYGLRPEQCPVAAACDGDAMALPLFPGMTEDDVDTVGVALERAIGVR